MNGFSNLDPRIDGQSFQTGATNTMLDYLYRDANNFKQDESVVFAGALTIDQVNMLLSGTDDDNGFVPSAVGLDDLQPRTVDGWQAEADHPFHEIAHVSLVNRPPTTPQTAEEFLARFLAANWEKEGERVEAENAAAA